MHNAPSEASILRSMYEKEVSAHAVTKESLKRVLAAFEFLAEQQAMPDDSWRKIVADITKDIA